MITKRIWFFAAAGIVVLVIVAFALRLADGGHSNPILNKTWSATVFTGSNGSVQHNPDEKVRFLSNEVVLRVGSVINRVPVDRYRVIAGLHQGATPYDTVLVYSSKKDYIRVFVFNHAHNILIVRHLGDLTIQQRFKIDKQD